MAEKHTETSESRRELKLHDDFRYNGRKYRISIFVEGDEIVGRIVYVHEEDTNLPPGMDGRIIYRSNRYHESIDEVAKRAVEKLKLTWENYSMMTLDDVDVDL